MNNKNKKKILITGANGAVGFELIRQLCIIDEYDIIAVDKNFSNLKEYENKITLFQGDICDKTALKTVFDDVKYVVHLAAKVHQIPNSTDDIDSFYKVNTIATKDIFDLCLDYKVEKVIFLSTISVYGDNNEEVLNEYSKVKPVSHYAISKFKAEESGMTMVREKGLPLCILRPATIFGYLDKGNYGSLISMCQKGLAVFPGKGLNLKPVIYVKDIAGAILKMIDYNYTAGDIFIISQDNYSYFDIIKSIETVFKVKTIKMKIPKLVINFLYKNLRLKTFIKLKTLSRSIQLDNSKMIKILKYIPQYNLISGLQDCKNYYISKK